MVWNAVLIVIIHLQDGATPLYIACQEGHLPVVEQLIAAKVDVDCQKKVCYLSLIGMHQHGNLM